MTCAEGWEKGYLAVWCVIYGITTPLSVIYALQIWFRKGKFLKAHFWTAALIAIYAGLRFAQFAIHAFSQRIYCGAVSNFEWTMGTMLYVVPACALYALNCLIILWWQQTLPQWKRSALARKTSFLMAMTNVGLLIISCGYLVYIHFGAAWYLLSAMGNLIFVTFNGVLVVLFALLGIRFRQLVHSLRGTVKSKAGLSIKLFSWCAAVCSIFLCCHTALLSIDAIHLLRYHSFIHGAKGGFTGSLLWLTAFHVCEYGPACALTIVLLYVRFCRDPRLKMSKAGVPISLPIPDRGYGSSQEQINPLSFNKG